MASSALSLPWLWIIEALASEQIDSSILKELVKRTPEIAGDLGNNARDMVRFRILDTLDSQHVRSNGRVSLAPVPENKIDSSESCEIVACMLHKGTGEAEMLKSEIQNFITQKRASLPKFTLQKLKDAILEGKHPALAAFKVKSGLSTGNKVRVRASTAEGGDLTSPNAEILNDLSGKDCGNRNLTPSKRDVSHLENENQAFRSHTDNMSLDHVSDTHLQITKKPKHGASVTGLVVGVELLPTGRDEPEMELDLPDKEAVDDPRFCAEIGTSNVEPPIRAHEDICNETNPNIEKSHSNFPHEAQHDMGHNQSRECSSDSDDYHEERLDIFKGRCDFLSSHCSFTQESLATADCTELSFCTKCEKGGDLLVCSGAACPIVVHQNCLGTEPNFDNSGKFFCPFCSYSHAISEYLEIKKRASLARKNLAVFIGLEKGHRPTKIGKKCTRPEHGQHRQDENVNRDNEKHETHVNDAINCENRVNIGNMQQAEPSMSNGNPHLRVEDALKDDEIVFASKENNGEGGKIGPECRPVMALEREQLGNGHRTKQITKKSMRPEHNQPKQDKDVKRNSQKHQNHVNHAINFEKIGPECQPTMALKRQQIEAHDSQIRGQNGSPCWERENLVMTKQHATKQDDHVPNADVAASSEEDDRQLAIGYIMRPRNLEMQYTYPAIPQMRRKRVPWTPEEEEFLEEGVKKFSGNLDKAKKWKDILEFGSRVFQKVRTPIDLKDKWRNICKQRAKL